MPAAPDTHQLWRGRHAYRCVQAMHCLLEAEHRSAKHHDMRFRGLLAGRVDAEQAGVNENTEMMSIGHTWYEQYRKTVDLLPPLDIHHALFVGAAAASRSPVEGLLTVLHEDAPALGHQAGHQCQYP